MRGLFLLALLSGLLPLNALAQYDLALKQITFHSLEKKSADGPIVQIPDISLGPVSSATVPLNHAVTGSSVNGPTTLSNGSVTVSAPSTATAVDAPAGTLTLTLPGGSFITLNASWTPSADGEFRAGCLVDNQGPQGIFDGVEGVAVPLQATKNYGTTLALRYEPNNFDDYYYGASFSTGSEGGYIRGCVDIIYTLETEEEPIRVDTLVDVSDGNFAPGEQSLREAMFRAGQKDVEVDIPIFVSGVISLQNGLISTSGTNAERISLLPLAGDLTLDAQGASRILVVQHGHDLWVFGIDFINGLASGTGDGGAVINAGTLEMRDCLFKNNVCGGIGGAILNNGNLSIEHCSFSRNGAQHGAAIFTAEAAQTRVRDSTFFGNLSQTAEVLNSTLEVAPTGMLNVLNSTIVVSDVAVYSEGQCDLHHCTLLVGSHNLVVSGSSGNVKLDHCVLDNGNVVRAETRAVENGTITSLGYNALRSANPGNFNPLATDIIGRPLHVKLSGESVILLGYSPCVNAGNPDFAPGNFSPSLNFDISGRPRVEERIDIGAIEVSAEKLALLAVLRALEDGEDANQNGIPDVVDVLSGIDPTTDRAADSPVKVVSETPAAAALAKAVRKDGRQVTFEVRIDERATFVEGTLQTSEDLVTWTDRVVYQPQGAGQGVGRTGVNGATLAAQARAGYGWYLRERIDGSVMPRSARLKAELGVACAAVPAGIEAWYPGDGSMQDISGGGHHGTAQNGTGFGADQVEQAFEFDGINDAITLGDQLDRGAGDFSIEVWIKGDPGTGAWGRILDKGFSSGFALGRLATSRKVGFEFLASGSQGNSFGTTSDVIDNTWHHVAVVKSGTTVRIYADGVEENSETVSAASQQNSRPLLIGFNPGEGIQGYWKGSIDELAIYNRALSAQEIQAIFDAGSAGKCK